jgi:hypothetical protein
MRVAVLVSGSLRTFNSVWPQNEKVLSSIGLDYDLYLQTWDKNVGSHRGVAKGKSPRRLFFRWYPTKFASLSNYDPSIFVGSNLNLQISVDELHEIDKLLPQLRVVSQLKNGQRFANSAAMYFGMEKVAKMAIDSKVEYTHFLRLRTDFELHKDFDLENTQYLVMCGDGVRFDKLLVSDQCFYGPFNLVDPTMFNFRFLKNIVATDGWYSNNENRSRKAEFVLYENLSNYKLLHLVREIPRKKFGKIRREDEIRDNSVTYQQHFKGILSHNKSVLMKLIKLFWAEKKGASHLASILKLPFRRR